MTKSEKNLWPTSEYNMPRVLLLCCVANFPNCDILSHTEVHRLDNSVITTLSCSVNNRSHHKWLSEQNRLIFCSIYNFIWSSCEIWKLHQNYLLMFIVKLISEPSWAALFIFLVQQLVLKVKCRNKYLQPRKRSHVWRLVRVEKVLSRLQSSTNGPPSTPQHKSCVAAATFAGHVRHLNQNTLTPSSSSPWTQS